MIALAYYHCFAPAATATATEATSPARPSHRHERALDVRLSNRASKRECWSRSDSDQLLFRRVIMRVGSLSTLRASGAATWTLTADVIASPRAGLKLDRHQTKLQSRVLTKELLTVLPSTSGIMYTSGSSTCEGALSDASRRTQPCALRCVIAISSYESFSSRSLRTSAVRRRGQWFL